MKKEMKILLSGGAASVPSFSVNDGNPVTSHAGDNGT